MTIEKLKQLARQCRADIVRMIHGAGGGHIGPALSCVDILCVLYFAILNVRPDQPEWEERDRFILSKGHGCAALYAVLARRGFFPVDTLDAFGTPHTILGGHPDRHKVPGVEASTGSLGHGLALGTGMALAAKNDRKAHRIFVLLSDGECQAGSTWEAALFAHQKKLDNLVAIIDYNRMQAIDRLDNVVSLDPIRNKWDAFGWAARETDGHDHGALRETLQRVPFEKNRPSVIIARTVKGKGVSYMENNVIWHTRAPTDEELAQALVEIGSE